MSKKITLSLSDKNRPNLLLLFSSYMRNRRLERSRRRKRNLGGGILVDVDDAEYAEILDYWDNMFPGWDDEEDDYPREEDYDVIYPIKSDKSKRGGRREKEDVYRQYWDQKEREERWARNLMGKSSGKKKHKRHGKNSRARVIDIRKPMDGFISDDEYNLDDIHYEKYDDISNAKIIFYPDYHVSDDKICFRTVLEFSDFCEENGYFVPGYVVDDMVYRGENHCCLNPAAKSKGILEILSEASYGEMFYEVCNPEELQ